MVKFDLLGLDHFYFSRITGKYTINWFFQKYVEEYNLFPLLALQKSSGS